MFFIRKLGESSAYIHELANSTIGDDQFLETVSNEILFAWIGSPEQSLIENSGISIANSIWFWHLWCRNHWSSLLISMFLIDLPRKWPSLVSFFMCSMLLSSFKNSCFSESFTHPFLSTSTLLLGLLSMISLISLVDYTNDYLKLFTYIIRLVAEAHRVTFWRDFLNE